MIAGHRPDENPPVQVAQEFGNLTDDETVAQLLAQTGGRNIFPDELAFLEAEKYARWFMRLLRTRTTICIPDVREDCRSDYYAGALEAIRRGATRSEDIAKAGRTSLYHGRKLEARWRKLTKSYECQFNRELFDSRVLASLNFPEDQNAVLNSMIQSGVLESCIDRLPYPGQRILRALTYGEYYGRGFGKPDERELAGRLNMSEDQLQRHKLAAKDALYFMIIDAVRNAPSCPEANRTEEGRTHPYAIFKSVFLCMHASSVTQ